MSGWIKLDKDMPHDPRLLHAAAQISIGYVGARATPGGGVDLEPSERLGFFVMCSLGALMKLWTYADEHISDDDTLPITVATLDAFVGLDGFYDSMPREWVTETDDGRVKLPRYREKNHVVAKKSRRIKQQEYTRRWRAKSAHDVSISHGANGAAGEHPKTKTDTKTKTEEIETPLPPFAIPPEIEPGAWGEWLAFRRESRFSMKPSALRQHVKLLARYSPTIQREIIESSIGSHWQGLFAPKGKAAALDPDPFANWQPPPDTDHDPH